MDLFNQTGAEFSPCGKYRYVLWRIWEKEKPLVMFIGLNPSTANGEKNDPTIESVIRLCKFNGYGGVCMMNCWAQISTDPSKLEATVNDQDNIERLHKISQQCKDVVFAWGNFSVVKKYAMDVICRSMFPNALCINKNKNGSPGHPLFKKGEIRFVKF